MNIVEKRFQNFLAKFEPRVIKAYAAAGKSAWNAAVNATNKNVARSAKLGAKCSMLYSNPKIYKRLANFQASGRIQDPVQKRILDLLILAFRGHMLPKDMISEIATKEAEICQAFDQFRPMLNGKPVTDNDILNILRQETDIARRQEAWAASKQVGAVVAPLLKDLVALRNRAAHLLGFANYFEMSYALQELDPQEVTGTFAELGRKLAQTHEALLGKVNSTLAKQFGVAESELGPWAWSDPFCQENPLTARLNPDALFHGKDIMERVGAFYASLGMDLRDIYTRSDLYERDNKNPHASCWDIDRNGDVRILANIRPDLRWYTTGMHESGHAAYYVGIRKDLPRLLRDPAHILTTEAIAIFFEQTGERAETMKKLFGFGAEHDELLRKIEAGCQERRLIFAQWAIVVTLFEKEMYEDPEQDLQELWWNLVEKYQKIKRPAGREFFADYAAKIHVSASPCYYQNYLLADIVVSELRNVLADTTGTYEMLGNTEAGRILQERFYGPGSSCDWKKLVSNACGKPFSIDDIVHDLTNV